MFQSQTMQRVSDRFSDWLGSYLMGSGRAVSQVCAICCFQSFFANVLQGRYNNTSAGWKSFRFWIQ